MKNRLTNVGLDLLGRRMSPRRQLAEVLEDYLADLEQGNAPDQEALLAAHPDLADELRPYLDSLRLLHGATRDMRVNRQSAHEPNGAATNKRRRHGKSATTASSARSAAAAWASSTRRIRNRSTATWR